VLSIPTPAERHRFCGDTTRVVTPRTCAVAPRTPVQGEALLRLEEGTSTLTDTPSRHSGCMLQLRMPLQPPARRTAT